MLRMGKRELRMKLIIDKLREDGTVHPLCLDKGEFKQLVFSNEFNLSDFIDEASQINFKNYKIITHLDNKTCFNNMCIEVVNGKNEKIKCIRNRNNSKLALALRNFTDIIFEVEEYIKSGGFICENWIYTEKTK